MRPARSLRRPKTLQERRNKWSHRIVMAAINEDTVRFCRFKRRARGGYEGWTGPWAGPFIELNRAGRERYWSIRGFRHLVTKRFLQ